MDAAGTLEQDVRAATSALAALLPHAASYGEDVAGRMKKLCGDVEPALARTSVSLGVAGDAASRRALLRTLLGEAVIRGPASKRQRIVRVRAAETFDYVARGAKMEPVRFARLVPDRTAAYQRSIEEAEARVHEAERAREQLGADVEAHRTALREAENRVRELDERLEAMGAEFAEAWRVHRAAETKRVEIEKAAPELPPLLVQAPPWWALWLWVVRWMLTPRYREPLALYAHNRAAAQVAGAKAAELGTVATQLEAERERLKGERADTAARIEQTTTALAAAEVALADESAVAAANKRLESLLRDRSLHAGERKEEFQGALRDIDATAKGDGVDVLDVDLPFEHPGAPPKDVVLVFAEEPPDEVDGLLIVGRTPPPGLAALRERMPEAAALSTFGADLMRAALERVRDGGTIVPRRLARRLRACIADIARARAEAEREHEQRLTSLESQRIPHPEDFRARQLARSEPAIEKGADEVLAKALPHVATVFEDLRKEWADRISRETTRRGIEARIAELNERGSVRVLELVEGTCELIVREMQTVGESLERWALDEIQASYHTVKRRRIESLMPVASDVTSEDLTKPIAAIVPVAGPREAWRRKRLLLGAGGCLSAAAIGTLVRPGVGTVVGAVLGVLATLLASPASLRAATVARINAYVTDASAKVQAALEGKRPDLIVGIRAALDDALRDTLERLNETITRLMNVERAAIEGERHILAELQATRGTLDMHDERLRAALAGVES